MSRRAALLSLPALASCLALAGCGASSGHDQAAGTGTAGAKPVPSRVPLAAVTDGRTGDAVTRTNTGAVRRLSHGGRLDPSVSRGVDRRGGVGAGAVCPDTELVPAPDTVGRVDAITLCLLNGERADHGRPPLTVTAKLASAATAHAADMVAKSYFAHEGPDGSDVKSRIDATGYIPASGRWVIGENLAWGTGALATPKAIVDAWMNSEGHRANILHPDYREIGFGTVVGNPRTGAPAGATYATEFGVVGEPDAVAPKVAVRRTVAARRVGTHRRSAHSRRAHASKVKAKRARVSRVKGKRSRAQHPRSASRKS